MLIVAVVAIHAVTRIAEAQKQSALPVVDYNNEVIVDSDLDGLTDKGEQQIYNTDPGNPDTDGDGFLDGVEIMSGTNPSDSGNPGNVAAEKVSQITNNETPWAWYITRAAGVLGFIFLWFTVFLGLSIRNPILKKVIEPIYSFSLHCFVAAMSVFWALVHGTSLLFDSSAQFKIKDIAVPFFSKTTIVDVNYLALGIMAFYMMVVIATTSYMRKRLNHKFWRVLHFLNPVAFVFVVVHGYMNGTDMKNFYVGSTFLFSSFVLVLIYLSSLIFIIAEKIRKVIALRNTLSQ